MLILDSLKGGPIHGKSLCNFTDMFPQKIKRVDCFLECASFIGCQANKALVAETSAVQQTGREKAVTEKRGIEIKHRQAQDFKSHQVNGR